MQTQHAFFFSIAFSCIAIKETPKDKRLVEYLPAYSPDLNPMRPPC